jgi:hypothetical protein
MYDVTNKAVIIPITMWHEGANSRNNVYFQIFNFGIKNLISKNNSELVCHICRSRGKVACCYCSHCLWCSVNLYVEVYKEGFMLD